MREEPSPPGAESGEAPWYRRAFRAGYLELYAHRDETDARRAVDFIRREVGFGPERRLLDLCCGAGRHLKLLAPHFEFAVGLDLSRELLARAREDAGAMGVIEGDMRALPFAAAQFDVTVNLFTSFGYFEDERENARVVEEAARALRPGGVFVHDHINREFLEANFQPESERGLPGGGTVRERRRFDRETGRVIKRLEWETAGGEVQRWEESVRVYRPGEIEEMFGRAGLEVFARFGDFDGWALESGAPRMITLARRAG